MNRQSGQWLWLLLPVLLGCYLFLGSHAGMAHALLVRSTPAAGAELAAAPPAIDLWFSEPLEGRFSTVYLVDTAGVEIGKGDATVDAADPTHMTLVPPPLAPGIYTVVWRTLSSADGHEWVGSFPLTLLNPDGSPLWPSCQRGYVAGR
ncbi:MAG: copper resistance protein CopC [Caldilineaceae bacterium]